jgi:hypothetical protein
VDRGEVTIDDLAAHVGVELFERACTTARATASATGRSRDASPWPDDEADVPHELSSLIEGDAALGFQLYRAMPCYAVLMYVGFEPQDAAFWSEVKALLDDPDDRLAVPMTYWLWCGPFESTREAAVAWPELTADAPDLRLGRLLSCCGPVTWSLKQPLFEQLAARPEWRSRLFSALEDSAYDYYGSVNAIAAQDLLNRLKLPTDQTARLRERLQELAKGRKKG